LIIEVSDKILKDGDIYIDIAEKLLGNKLKIMIKFFFSAGCLSVCIGYAIFFGIFFDNALGDALPSYVYTLFSVCIIFPMCLLKDLTFYVKYMSLANLVMVFVLISIVI